MTPLEKVKSNTFVVGQYDNTRIEENFIRYVCSYTTETGERHTIGPFEDVSWPMALEFARMRVRWKGRYTVTVIRID